MADVSDRDPAGASGLLGAEPPGDDAGAGMTSSGGRSPPNTVEDNPLPRNGRGRSCWRLCRQVPAQQEPPPPRHTRRSLTMTDTETTPITVALVHGAFA